VLGAVCQCVSVRAELRSSYGAEKIGLDQLPSVGFPCSVGLAQCHRSLQFTRFRDNFVLIWGSPPADFEKQNNST
jgi:hypothetical protein